MRHRIQFVDKDPTFGLSAVVECSTAPGIFVVPMSSKPTACPRCGWLLKAGVTLDETNPREEAHQA